jgi:predicted alpha/beta superfamily hydrolase
MDRRSVALGLAATGLSAAGVAAAQPRRNAPVTPTVADLGSQAYRFERFTVRSADGLRGYRITVAAPQAAAPSGGYGVLYALDGNLALGALDEALLQRLATGSPPVVVAIAHDGETAIDPLARAFDYTPAPPGMRPGDVVDPAGRPGGGATAFVDLIDQAIRPVVEDHLSINPAGETLWGHSYGGLFALHAAFSRPFLFSRYVAVSPSLWWNYGSVLQGVPDFLAAPRPPGLALDILVGGEEIQPRDPAAPPRHPMWTSLEPGEAGRLAARLEAAGVRVSYTVLPDLSHGATLAAGLRGNLLAMAGIEGE